MSAALDQATTTSCAGSTKVGLCLGVSRSIITELQCMKGSVQVGVGYRISTQSPIPSPAFRPNLVVSEFYERLYLGRRWISAHRL